MFSILGVLCMIFITISSKHSTQYYISSNGMDHDLCGNQSLPCGTLYRVSIFINQINGTSSNQNTVEIYIVDGQNRTEIMNYLSLNNTDNYDPCLAIPFNETLHIIINFNSQLIHDITDWYPYNLCSQNSIQYKNKYIFDGGKSLKISNLIINDYIITETLNYPLIQSKQYYNTSITCIECTFSNITSMIDDNHLIHTVSSIHLIDTTFSDIQTSVYVIEADHSLESDEATRRIIIENSLFVNVSSAKGILHTGRSANDLNHGALLEINKCIFRHVSVPVDEYIIYDGLLSPDVKLVDTDIYITSGLIYYPHHTHLSHIHIYNVSIHTNLLNTKDAEALIYVAGADEVNIQFLNILYEYNTSGSCQYEETKSNYILNVTFATFECTNPIKLVENNGHIEMRDVTIDMKIKYYDEAYITVYHFESDTTDFGFIVNKGILDVVNMNIKHGICYFLIVNENALTVYNMTFDSSSYINFNPNNLHPRIIILHLASSYSTLFVSNSHFIGSKWQIWTTGGTAQIINSTFERCNEAVKIQATLSFTLSDCTFQNVGSYYGVILNDYKVSIYASQPIQLWWTQNIIVTNNYIYGFDPKGFLYFHESNNITLKGNTININTDHFFYNVSAQSIRFTHNPLWFTKCSKTRIIDNDFIENILYANTSWLKYEDCAGINCLSGNTFSNSAIYVVNTEVTSCFRQNLIDSGECHSVYGVMDESLINTVTNIVLNDAANITAMIIAENSTIAIDNVNITVIGNDPVIVFGNVGNILFFDSYITPNHDISYDKANCNVTVNDRLSNDIHVISKLFIKCSNVSDVHDLRQSIDSSNTQFVDHLSAVKINISAESLRYFPGELMKINYFVMDKVDNIISYNSSQEIDVRFEGNSFLTDIVIDSDGTCGICDSGLLINVLSINRNIGDLFKMDISVMNDILYILTDSVTLNISGCPIGYGPDTNNATCIECNAGYYNLEENNVQFCKSCDSKNNHGVECVDGNINLLYNHWVRFVDDIIISSVCPSRYCCRYLDGCVNIDVNNDILCALNRDFESILCGRCKSGYSESMTSTECVLCQEKYNFSYLLYPICLSLFIFVLIISINREKINMKQYPKLKPYSAVYLQLMMKHMILKNIMYYEQATAQILSQETWTILLYQLASIFNLSSTFHSILGYRESWCFMDGLTAKQKILIDSFVPITILLLVALSRIICDCNYNDKRVNFGKAFLSTYVIIVGSVLSVLFKLLNCQRVGDKMVHFYFGDEDCYGKTWNIAAIVLLIILVSFGLIFFKLWRMDPLQRQNRNQSLNRLVNKYKAKYYYWEFVLFIRRVIIALFAVSINENTFKFAFGTIMFFFLFVQYEYEPFMIGEANQLESILISFIICIIMLQISSSIDALFINVFVSTLIVLPYILLLFYICRTMKRRRKGFNSSGEAPATIYHDNEVQLAEIQKESNNKHGVISKRKGKRTKKKNNKDKNKIEIRFANEMDPHQTNITSVVTDDELDIPPPPPINQQITDIPPPPPIKS